MGTIDLLAWKIVFQNSDKLYTLNQKMSFENLETQLKQLMMDDDFTHLQNLVNKEVNLMDILRISHKELQHSNFLAWLFNPNETHNLGDYALKEFIKIYYRENQFQNLGNNAGLSVFDFVQLDFDDLEVRREYKNIDLIFLSKSNQFCIVIENKIYSPEKVGQLEKYRNITETEYPDFKHKIYIFLSLKDQNISEAEREYYVKLNYDHIIKLIDQILNNQRLNLAYQTKFVFEQYLQTLKSMLNKNEEIEKVAKQLYKKYKSAFDLVYKYSDPSGNNELWEILESLIAKENSIRKFTSNRTYLRFQPNYLYDNIQELRKIGFVSETDDLSNNWVFLFEFHFTGNQIFFDFKIGSGDQIIRQKLFEFYKKNKDVFPLINNGKGILKQWHPVFRKEILSSSEYESYSENSIEIENLLVTRFADLIHVEIPKLLGTLNK